MDRGQNSAVDPKHNVQSAGSKLEEEQNRRGVTRCCSREERNQTVEMKARQAANKEVKKRGRRVRQEGGRLEENLLSLDTNALQQNLKQRPRSGCFKRLLGHGFISGIERVYSDCTVAIKWQRRGNT